MVVNSQDYGKPGWLPGSPLFFFHHSELTLDSDKGTYELTLLKGDILHYCQSFTKSLKEDGNSFLLEQATRRQRL